VFRPDGLLKLLLKLRETGFLFQSLTPGLGHFPGMPASLVHGGQQGTQFSRKSLIAGRATEATGFLEITAPHMALGTTFPGGLSLVGARFPGSAHPEKDFRDRHDALHIQPACLGAILAEMKFPGLPVNHLGQVNGRLMLLAMFAMHATSRLYLIGVPLEEAKR
jgi:hypothetical protein